MGYKGAGWLTTDEPKGTLAIVALLQDSAGAVLFSPDIFASAIAPTISHLRVYREDGHTMLATHAQVAGTTIIYALDDAPMQWGMSFTTPVFSQRLGTNPNWDRFDIAAREP